MNNTKTASASLQAAAEALIAAYRQRYLNASTDRIRSNAPLLREMGELKAALQKMQNG